MASPALQLGPMMEVVKRFLDELTAGELAPVLAGLQLLEPVSGRAAALSRRFRVLQVALGNLHVHVAFAPPREPRHSAPRRARAFHLPTQVTLAACALALLAAAAALLRSLRAKRVYLLDFSVYKPPER